MCESSLAHTMSPSGVSSSAANATVLAAMEILALAVINIQENLIFICLLIIIFADDLENLEYSEYSE